MTQNVAIYRLLKYALFLSILHSVFSYTVILAEEGCSGSTCSNGTCACPNENCCSTQDCTNPRLLDENGNLDSTAMRVLQRMADELRRLKGEPVEELRDRGDKQKFGVTNTTIGGAQSVGMIGQGGFFTIAGQERQWGKFAVVELGCATLLFNKRICQTETVMDKIKGTSFQQKLPFDWRLIKIYPGANGNWTGPRVKKDLEDLRDLGDSESLVEMGEFGLNVLQLFPGGTMWTCLFQKQWLEGGVNGIVEAVPFMAAAKKLTTPLKFALIAATTVRLGQIYYEYRKTGKFNMGMVAESIILGMIFRHIQKGPRVCGARNITTRDAVSEVKSLTREELSKTMGEMGIPTDKANAIINKVKSQLDDPKLLKDCNPCNGLPDEPFCPSTPPPKKKPLPPPFSDGEKHPLDGIDFFSEGTRLVGEHGGGYIYEVVNAEGEVIGKVVRKVLPNPQQVEAAIAAWKEAGVKPVLGSSKTRDGKIIVVTEFIDQSNPIFKGSIIRDGCGLQQEMVDRMTEAAKDQWEEGMQTIFKNHPDPRPCNYKVEYIETQNAQGIKEITGVKVHPIDHLDKPKDPGVCTPPSAFNKYKTFQKLIFKKRSQ